MLVDSPALQIILVSCASAVRDSPEPDFPGVTRVAPTTTNVTLDIEDPGKMAVTESNDLNNVAHGSCVG